MAGCPNCGHDIEVDFGFEPCPNCGTLVPADDERPIDNNSSINDLGDLYKESSNASEESIVQSLLYQPDNDAHSKSESGSNLNNNSVDTENSISSNFENNDFEITKEPSIQQIEQFANSESSMLNEGVLKYEISLSGIDSSELKSRVISALQDKRLGSVIQEVTNISDGKLSLSNLNPVKASIVLQKLQSIPISVSWKQIHVFV